MDLDRWIRQRALELGFSRAGICDAHPPLDGDRLRAWVGSGRHATMGWMERTLPERLDPRRLLPGARSVVVVALSYAASNSGPAEPGALPPPAGAGGLPEPPQPAPPLTGRVSIYARGRDYHRVLVGRLEILRREIEARAPGCRTRVCVDTSPLLERYWARAAGVGWIGKNTNLIVQGLGSWIFLGALLCDLDLGPSGAPAPDRCGSCRRCLDACPTAAFDGAWRLDARRCISYLTIEHRGDIDPALDGRMGDWVFGCDDCQSVCPWNRFAVPTGVADLDHGAGTRLPLEALAGLDEAGFDALTRGRGLRRARRQGLRRNALAALGNSADPRAAEPLREALGDPDPVLRRQAARSLARLAAAGAAPGAAGALRARLEVETDPGARGALVSALDSLAPAASPAAGA